MKKVYIIIGILYVSCSTNDSDMQQSDQNTSNYEQVSIGSQIWIQRNLDVETYRDGTTIPQVSDPTEWANLESGAWCYFNNENANGAVYGKLYNWYAVNDPRGLAPAGWHIPSMDEWLELRDYIGGEAIAGGKMKEMGTVHWASPNEGATNESGFTSLPAGWRNDNGNFGSFLIGFKTAYWSSEGTADYVEGKSVFLNYIEANFSTGFTPSKMGLSIRCLKN